MLINNDVIARVTRPDDRAVGVVYIRDAVTGLAFSSDDARLVSASSDRTLRFWSVEAGAPLVTLRGHSDGVTCVAFDPDDGSVLSGSADETVRLWFSDRSRSRALSKPLALALPVAEPETGKGKGTQSRHL